MGIAFVFVRLRIDEIFLLTSCLTCLLVILILSQLILITWRVILYCCLGTTLLHLQIELLYLLNKQSLLHFLPVFPFWLYHFDVCLSIGCRLLLRVAEEISATNLRTVCLDELLQVVSVAYLSILLAVHCYLATTHGCLLLQWYWKVIIIHEFNVWKWS
jgi:hypothetical protein